jgi:hypothetical protein
MRETPAMTLSGKLQIKPGHTVVVLSPPDDLELGLDLGSAPTSEADALLVFVRSAADLDTEEVAHVLEAARRDRLAWVAYPKGKRLGTDLDRDSLAALLSARGVRPVRQIALDDTWSALRFRPGV